MLRRKNPARVRWHQMKTRVVPLKLMINRTKVKRGRRRRKSRAMRSSCAYSTQKSTKNRSRRRVRGRLPKRLTHSSTRSRIKWMKRRALLLWTRKNQKNLLQLKSRQMKIRVQRKAMKIMKRPANQHQQRMQKSNQVRRQKVQLKSDFVLLIKSGRTFWRVIN